MVNIPKNVEAQLQKGETVLSAISIKKWFQATDYYATDKRLLLFKGKSDYDSMDYGKMSIALKKYGGAWNITRVLILLLGLAVIGFGFLAMNPHFTFLGVNITGGGIDMALLMWFLGILCILIPIVFRYAYYQVDYSGSEEKGLKTIKFERLRFGSSKIDEFAEVLKRKIANP